MSVPAGSIRCLQYPFVTRRVEAFTVVQKIALTAIVDQAHNSNERPLLRGPRGQAAVWVVAAAVHLKG